MENFLKSPEISTYLYYPTGYAWLVLIVYLIFFRTKYHRSPLSPPLVLLVLSTSFSTPGCHLKVNGWEICLLNQFYNLQLCCRVRTLALAMHKKTLKRLPFTHFLSDFFLLFTKIFVWFSPFQWYLSYCSWVIGSWDKGVLCISRIIQPQCWVRFWCVFWLLFVF